MKKNVLMACLAAVLSLNMVGCATIRHADSPVSLSGDVPKKGTFIDIRSLDGRETSGAYVYDMVWAYTDYGRQSRIAHVAIFGDCGLTRIGINGAGKKYIVIEGTETELAFYEVGK